MPTLLGPLAIAALLFATAAWGSLFLVGKSLLAALDPIWFTAVRYTIATGVLLLLVAVFGRAPWRKLRVHFARLTWLGVVGYGYFSVMVFVGLAHSLPSHGAVIMATMPLTTLALRWALDGVRPAPRAWIAALIALGGVAIVSGLLGGQGTVTRGVLLGDAITLLGTLGWVLYTRGAASLPGFSPLEYAALTAAASWPWLVAGALLATVFHEAALPGAATIAGVLPKLLYVAAVPTVLAVLAFNFGVRQLGAPTGTLFLNAVPVSVLAMGALLGSLPHANELVGTALVGLALWLNVSGAPRPA